MICKHENQELMYGYASAYGLKGLVGYKFCIDCGKITFWQDDEQCDTPSEIEHNKHKLREIEDDL